MFSGDSMAYNNGRKFSTRDRDNDGESWINWAETHGRGGGVDGDIGCTAVSTTTHPVPQITLGFGGIFGMVETPYGSMQRCSLANLNGFYYHSPRTTDWTGIWWDLWHGRDSLKATTMMIQT